MISRNPLAPFQTPRKSTDGGEPAGGLGEMDLRRFAQLSPAEQLERLERDNQQWLHRHRELRRIEAEKRGQK